MRPNAAGAVLFHPEFYKVAVANSGCHDNRMDKASWNEQWMGYRNAGGDGRNGGTKASAAAVQQAFE